MKSQYYKIMGDSFKKNLREELNYQDLTVKELAAKIGIPKPTLDCYLSSREVMPPADIAVKIAQTLKVSVEYLITGSNTISLPYDYDDFKPFRYLLADLKKLDENQLETLTTMVHALAEKNLATL